MEGCWDEIGPKWRIWCRLGPTWVFLFLSSCLYGVNFFILFFFILLISILNYSYKIYLKCTSVIDCQSRLQLINLRWPLSLPPIPAKHQNISWHHCWLPLVATSPHHWYVLLFFFFFSFYIKLLYIYIGSSNLLDVNEHRHTSCHPSIWLCVFTIQKLRQWFGSIH